MQSELKMVKEFRRKRAQMQKELDEVGQQLLASITHRKMESALFLQNS